MIPLNTTTSTKVGALTQVGIKTPLSEKRLVVSLHQNFNELKMHLRAIREDLGAEGLLRFTNPNDIEALILLSPPEKIVLEALLTGDILSRIIILESTVSSLSTAVNNLEQRVTALETP